MIGAGGGAGAAGAAAGSVTASAASDAGGFAVVSAAAGGGVIEPLAAVLSLVAGEAGASVDVFVAAGASTAAVAQSEPSLVPSAVMVMPSGVAEVPQIAPLPLRLLQGK